LAYSAVQRYREQDLNPQTVGQNLPVRVVALREVTRSDDKLLLHVELVNVCDGTQLWGGQFKESYTDVLADPEKLADRICDQLRPILARKVSKGSEKAPQRAA